MLMLLVMVSTYAGFLYITLKKVIKTNNGLYQKLQGIDAELKDTLEVLEIVSLQKQNLIESISESNLSVAEKTHLISRLK